MLFVLKGRLSALFILGYNKYIRLKTSEKGDFCSFWLVENAILRVKMMRVSQGKLVTKGLKTINQQPTSLCLLLTSSVARVGYDPTTSGL